MNTEYSGVATELSPTLTSAKYNIVVILIVRMPDFNIVIIVRMPDF